jgi:thermitase
LKQYVKTTPTGDNAMFRLLLLCLLCLPAFAHELILRVEDPGAKIQGLHDQIQAKERRPFQLFTQFVLVEVPAPYTSKEAIAHYEKSALVRYAEPNYKVRLLDIQDPFWEDQWALNNTGQREGTEGSDVMALAAWEVFEKKRDLVVAVIDTGVDYNHPDLKQAMWKNQKEIPGNGVDDDDNGLIDDYHGYNFYDGIADPMDDHMHGTHCSGIIAAQHNDIGIRGLAPDVKIMPVKFLGAWGDGELENGIKAIEYALRMKADILSNSWGGPPYSKVLDEVLKEVKERGVLFIAAAGNDHNNNDASPTYPASYQHDNVIAVAATKPNDDIAKFSNWGLKNVHIGAPGRWVISTIPNNKYKTASGTSMAAPYVSAAAALVWMHRPELSYLDVKERLLSTVDHTYIMQEKVISGGRLNAYNALVNKQTERLPEDETWEVFPYDLETPHPYPNMANLSYKITHRGAKFIRLHFAKLETEQRVDYLGLKDGQEVMRETLSGDQGELWSRVIPGDTVLLNLRADSLNEFYGFKIDKYKVKY